MNSFVKTLSIITLSATIPAMGQVTTEETEVTQNADGTVTETTTTTTFTPDARTKVVEYFQTYEAEPYGLPPAWVTKIDVDAIPNAWTTTRIEPGVVIAADQRTHLVAAPPELVEILPDPTGDVDYYVAGSNVVAVDETYTVVDSIQIPSVKITVDE